MSIDIPSTASNNIVNNIIRTKEQDLREEIYELKDQISELKKENKKNSLKILELSNEKFSFSLLEQENQKLNEELISKDKIINELKNNILKDKKDKQNEKRELENKFDTKLIYYKRMKNTNEYKENAANSIIKLNEVQHCTIIQLENKIDEIKNFYENKLKEKEVFFDKKYTNLKKDMMDFLKNAQKNMIQTTKESLELNTKLGILYKNEMLNELENQSHLIEQLIKEKEQQNKEIYLLKQELLVHKKVEKLINYKNNKFLNIINRINIKINQNKNQNQTIDNNFNEEKGKTERLIKEEKHSSFNTIRDTNKRAKSVKSFKYIGNPGILSNYLSNDLSDLSKSNSKRIKSKIPSCKASEIVINKMEDKTLEYEENPLSQININNDDEKPEINNIINEIIILCDQALEIILSENKFNQTFKDISFLNDIDIKLDYYELEDELKYELLIEIIKRVLNFLKINNNCKKEKETIYSKKKNNDLLKLNDEYNVKFSKILYNENYNKVKKLKIKNQKLKYDKLLEVIKPKQPKNNSPDNFPSFNIKKNKQGNNMSNTYRKITPNPLNRFIHISKGLKKKDFFNDII